MCNKCSNGSKTSENALPVAGYEKKVSDLRGKLLFLKQLTDEVEHAKEEFRGLAKRAAASAAADVSTLAFQDGAGGVLTVSLPDPAKEGNRLSLSGAKLSKAVDLGLDISAHVETEQSYVLTGEWVKWLRSVVTAWEAQGVDIAAIPGTCDLKETTRLKASGVDWLRALAAAGGAGAEVFLNMALKAATVNVK